MGASGKLNYIDIKKYPIENIIDRLIKYIEDLEIEDGYISENYIKLYFELSESNSRDRFVYIFWTKVFDYTPEVGRIDYSGSEYPEINSDYLILYETDLQMGFQNFPSEVLSDIICKSEEIWT